MVIGTRSDVDSLYVVLKVHVKRILAYGMREGSIRMGTVFFIFSIISFILEDFS